VVTLVLDLLLTDQFLLRPRQLARSQAVAREFVNLIQKRVLHWFYFLRISAKIKREQPRDQGLDLGGADIIGETHLLADANEQTRNRFRRSFRAKREWMSRKKSALNKIARHRNRLFLLIFDLGQLNLFFARDRCRGHGRVQ